MSTRIPVTRDTYCNDAARLPFHVVVTDNGIDAQTTVPAVRVICPYIAVCAATHDVIDRCGLRADEIIPGCKYHL